MSDIEAPHLERRLWPLLVLNSTEDGRLSPVQMQKTLFLFGAKMPSITRYHWYHFEPYHYGPFDQAVYRDIEELRRAGMVEQIGEEGDRVFSITEHGKALARETLDLHASLNLYNAYLRRLATWVKSLSFSRLIKSVYSAFPEYQVNSVFRK